MSAEVIPIPRRTISWPNWDYLKLSPLHEKIYTSNAKKLLFSGGRATGKDHLLFYRVTRIMLRMYAQRKLNQHWHRLGPVVNVGILAPVSTNFADLWRRFADMLPDIPGNSKDGTPNVRVLQDTQTVELFGRNELVIQFNSAFRADNIRGGGFDILLGTEVAWISEKDLTEAIFPLTIRPNYAGIVMLNSSPGGPDCWWDNAILEALAHKGYWGDWECYQGTYLDNPTTTLADVEEARKEKAHNIYRYRREKLGWLRYDIPDSQHLGKGELLAFTPEQIDAMIHKPADGIPLPAEIPQPVPPFWTGVDLATTGPDKAALVTVDSTGCIVHVEVHSKCSDDELVEIVERHEAYWHPEKLSYDGHGRLGKMMQGRLKRVKGNPVQYIGRKSEVYDHLRAHITQKTVWTPDPYAYAWPGKYQQSNIQLLLRELRGLRKYELVKEVLKGTKITEVMKTTYGKGPNGSDDLADALALAVWARPVPRRAEEIAEEQQSLSRLVSFAYGDD